MAKALDFRRRREALTDYRKRLSMVRGGIDRIVIRKTNRRIIAEIVRYGEKGDSVLAYVDSSLLTSKYKWPSRSNRPTAYLTGLELARLAAEKIGDLKSREYVLDIGLSSPVKNSIPFVFARGCADGGLRVRENIEIKKEVYDYSNTEYAAKAAAGGVHYSSFAKEGVGLERLGSAFEETRKKIMNK